MKVHYIQNVLIVLKLDFHMKSYHLILKNCLQSLIIIQILTKVNFYIRYSKTYFIFNLYFIVLAVYGFKYLGYDTKMSVLCFLHISNDNTVDECFNGCEGVLSTKLALYIYALRYAHKNMRNIDFFKLSTDQVCNFF